MERLSFGEVVRRYRIQRGLTQDQLAEKAGTDGSYISRLERNVEKAPGHDMAQRLISALEAPEEPFLRSLGYESRDPRADLIIAGRSIEGLTEDDLRIVEQVAERLRVRTGKS